jgi:NAD(P)-dependent dehydrogenase (short-subunit alcohol dehydrogenase family)
MEDMFRLDGKVALVTGGAGGIGRVLALGLSQYGAQVVVSSRNQEALVEAAAQIQAQTGREAHAIAADVTDENSMQRLVSTIMAKLGAVDILVNAMGLNVKRNALEYPMDEWDRLFEVNVKGTMIACKQVGQVFKEKKTGKVINLSSVRGVRGHTGGNVGYCATKGAVELITRALALEWAPYHINVNALGPSLIITPGTVHIKNNPRLAEQYRATVPLGRLGEPGDLIGACVFLASGASDFITGQTIYVDGGLTAG